MRNINETRKNLKLFFPRLDIRRKTRSAPACRKSYRLWTLSNANSFRCELMPLSGGKKSAFIPQFCSFFCVLNAFGWAEISAPLLSERAREHFQNCSVCSVFFRLVSSSVLDLLEFDSNSNTNIMDFCYYFITLIGIEFEIRFSLELGSFLSFNCWLIIVD